MHQCINVLAAHFVRIDMSILLPNIYAYFILKKNIFEEILFHYKFSSQYEQMQLAATVDLL